MTMSAARRSEAGFTQIEVLTAMLIIGLATPFLMGGVLGGLRQAHHSQQHAAATAWVQGEIDALRRRCFTDLGPSVRTVTPQSLAPGDLPLPAGFQAGVIEIAAAQPGLLRATVSLYQHAWSGSTPREPALLSVTTYVGDLRVAGQCP
jgi:type II secretory pathway pseudopilin PulG